VTYDLVIVGGGPAGAFAAVTARRAGLRTAIVDQGGATTGCRVGDVIPPHGRRLLESAGVLAMLGPNDYLESCGTRSAWGSPSLAATDFIMSPLGSGWHVDRAAFNRALLAAAAAEGSTILSPARALDARRDRYGWQITLSVNGRMESLVAATLLDCSGRSALIARRQGASRLVDAAQTALIAWLETPRDTDRDATLVVESAPDGWWYSARLPAGNRVVGFITRLLSPALRHARIAAGWQALVARTAHVGAICRTHGYVLRQPPAVVSAASSRLDRIAGPDWAAAGDAAASFDPLAAQGILTAMLSGTFAAAAMAAHLGGGGAALADYARRLQGIHAEHVRACRRYYAVETRWPASPFWAMHAAQGESAVESFVA